MRIGAGVLAPHHSGVDLSRTKSSASHERAG